MAVKVELWEYMDGGFMDFLRECATLYKEKRMVEYGG
jgi:hypothetical protein